MTVSSSRLNFDEAPNSSRFYPKGRLARTGNVSSLGLFAFPGDRQIALAHGRTSGAIRTGVAVEALPQGAIPTIRRLAVPTRRGETVGNPFHVGARKGRNLSSDPAGLGGSLRNLWEWRVKMRVTIRWFEGQYPSFNVQIASKEGAEPFLEVKGCKIMHGSNGEFVSWPSTKNQQTGKYWNHCYASEKFAAHVLNLAKESQPVKQEAKKPAPEDDLDVPF